MFEGTRCVGVKALVEGKETEFRGGEVIVSSGAIHSPAHLLRAGIGPAGHLRDLGRVVPVVRERMVRVGDADLGIGPPAGLAGELERDDPRDVPL